MSVSTFIIPMGGGSTLEEVTIDPFILLFTHSGTKVIPTEYDIAGLYTTTGALTQYKYYCLFAYQATEPTYNSYWGTVNPDCTLWIKGIKFKRIGQLAVAEINCYMNGNQNSWNVNSSGLNAGVRPVYSPDLPDTFKSVEQKYCAQLTNYSGSTANSAYFKYGVKNGDKFLRFTTYTSASVTNPHYLRQGYESSDQCTSMIFDWKCAG